MKILCIGDPHGKDVSTYFEIKGSKIIHTSTGTEVDILLLVGDYCDQGTYDPATNRIVQTTSNVEIFDRLKYVIQVKEQMPDKVVLLVGNHDYHYMYHVPPCSGFRPAMGPPLSALFSETRHLFKFAHKIKNFLFTHAGVTKSFFDRYVWEIMDKYEVPIDEALNYLGEKTDIMWTIPRERGGIGDVASFIWVHKSGLIEDPLPNYVQVVGHTRTQNTEMYNDASRNSTLFFIDHLSDDDDNSTFLLEI